MMSADFVILIKLQIPEKLETQLSDIQLWSENDIWYHKITIIE